MAMIHAMLAELEQESQATRRLLERVPEDRLSWRPHPRSFSLGQIALHVASLPGGISRMAAEAAYQVPDFRQREAESRAELLTSLDEGIATAREVLGGMSDERLADAWTLQDNGEAIMQLPRAALLRGLLLNHWYHHRGQLTVYLRLLDVPVPSTYGPTADVNPFARPAAAAAPAGAGI
jgi:uncharacterized damage-inducible protein DinB